MKLKLISNQWVTLNFRYYQIWYNFFMKFILQLISVLYKHIVACLINDFMYDAEDNLFVWIIPRGREK